MNKEGRAAWKERDEKVERFLKEDLDSVPNYKSVWALLVYSIREASKSADRLSKRVVWLNVSLVALGLLGLVVAAYGVFCK